MSLQNKVNSNIQLKQLTHDTQIHLCYKCNVYDFPSTSVCIEENEFQISCIYKTSINMIESEVSYTYIISCKRN